MDDVEEVVIYAKKDTDAKTVNTTYMTISSLCKALARMPSSNFVSPFFNNTKDKSLSAAQLCFNPTPLSKSNKKGDNEKISANVHQTQSAC